MALKMDLHMHSTYSDGSMRPVELVKKYYDEEYATIALTDHDGIGGVREAQIAGEALGIQVISGIEFSTQYDGRIGLHILGYRIDIDNEELNARLDSILAARTDRNERLMKVLNDMGYHITWEDVKQRPDQTYIGKPNFALALLKKGYVSDAKEAFSDKILGSEEVNAVKKEKISSREAIALIKGAGGTASLAHPMKIKKIGEKGSEEFFQELDRMVGELKKMGLGALECFHPSADHEQSLRLIKIAEKYKLHITQGSDYHGPEF